METDVEAKDIQIDEDLDFQRKQFVIERVGWAAMAALVLAALLGVFGRGKASHASAGRHDGPLWIQYESRTRWQSQTEMVVRAMPSATLEGGLPIRVNWDFLKHIELVEVRPQPLREIAGVGDVTFIFAVTGQGPVEVKFVYEPATPGSVPIEISAGDDGPLRFDQLVLP